MTYTVENTTATSRIVLTARGEMLFTREAGVWAYADFVQHKQSMGDAQILQRVSSLKNDGWAVVNVNGKDVK